MTHKKKKKRKGKKNIQHNVSTEIVNVPEFRDKAGKIITPAHSFKRKIVKTIIHPV